MLLKLQRAMMLQLQIFTLVVVIRLVVVSNYAAGAVVYIAAVT